MVQPLPGDSAYPKKEEAMEIKSAQNPDLKISSRYGRYRENVELQNFVNLLDMFCLSEFLTEIFYDSGCYVVFYKFKPLPSCIEHMIKGKVDDVAAVALCQYEDSRGIIAYGAIMEDQE